MPDQPNIQTIRTSTQSHLDIYEITDDIVILKDGSGCLVLSATAINFSLLSEEEQEATIYAYAAILNSLTYPIQILIHSERKDISDYLKHIKLLEDTQSNKRLKEHIRRYRRFVEETVQTNNVLDKSFYIIIPFTALELGAPQALFSSFTGSATKLPFPLSYIIDKAINHLHPKRDHLIRQFMRLGIRLQQLSTPELIELFYGQYNPDLSRGTKLDISKNYAAPIVQGPSAMNAQLKTKIDQFQNSTGKITPDHVTIPNQKPQEQPVQTQTTAQEPQPTSTNHIEAEDILNQEPATETMPEPNLNQ